jgi:hypothetical protein
MRFISLRGHEDTLMETMDNHLQWSKVCVGVTPL